MTSTQSQTIVDVLVSDHAAVLALLDRLEADAVRVLADATVDLDEQLREQLVIELVRHFVAEEQYLYPLVRAEVADGDRLAEVAFEANRTCEHELKALENPQADAQYLAVALATVRRQLTAHIATQQDQLFPILNRQVDPARLVELADEVLGAEQLAPTRPRLLAASNPALSKFSSVVEGFIDHVRDSYSHRGLGADDVE